MASGWFSNAASADYTKIFDTIKEKTNSVVSSELSSSITKTIKDLSLNSDEMKAERALYANEEKEKLNKVQWDYILPWETNDEKQTILCEECKEMIMKLSYEDSTFLGPYNKSDEGLDEAAAVLLPENFDVETYLKVIEKLLEIDEELKYAHFDLIGEGKVDDTDFWRNYFHHCALKRIEIGLKPEEIWYKEKSVVSDENDQVEVAAESVGSCNNSSVKDDGCDSVNSKQSVIHFSKATTTTAIPASVDVTVDTIITTSGHEDEGATQEKKEKSSNVDDESSGNSFENVSTSDLDNLAAEIAAELGDLGV